MIKQFILVSLAGALIACAHSSTPAHLQLATANTDGTLNTEQIVELQKAISILSDIKPTTALGNRAFTQTSRLTIGPKNLPAGAVTKHLENIFLLKTNGKDCFLVNEKTEEVLRLLKLECKPLR